MGIRTIAISTCMLVAVCAPANAAQATLSSRPDEPTLTAVADTLESNESRKRRKIEEAFKGKKTADHMAEGGIDYDPFGKEFMSKRHNPYTYSVEENKRKERERMGEDTVYIKKRRQLWKKMFIQGNMGFTQIAPLSSYTFKPAITFGGAIGFKFNDLHSIRVGGTFGRFKSNDLPESMVSADGGIDYMFNLTNYMYGVNAKRWVDFSPVIGLGITHSRNSIWRFTGGRARVALNVSRRLSGDSHIFVEPYMTLAQDKMDNSKGNPRQYDVLWGVHAGIRLNMERDTLGPALYMPDYNPNLFIDFSMGANQYWVNGDLKYSLTKTNGANYQLMFGKWFDPLLGMRIGFASGDCYWRHKTTLPGYFGNTQVSPEVKTYYRCGVANGRVELMFRPMNCFNRWREMTRKFELDVTGGVDLGAYIKTDVMNYGTVRTWFIGYTMAIDLLYQIAPGTSIFIEPRGQWLNFNVANASYGKQGNFIDRHGSLNLGLRIQRPVIEERENFFAGEFEPGLEVSVFGGSTKYVRRNKQVTEWNPNWLAGANLTYHITPYHSAMFEVEFDRMNQQFGSTYSVQVGNRNVNYRGFVNQGINLLTAKLAYRLNISNLVMERNYDRRRFNLYGFLGPTLSYHLPTDYTLTDGNLVGGSGEPVIYDEDLKGDTSMGLCGGFISSYSLTPRIAVNLRPEAQLYFAESFFGHHSHKQIFQVKISAGVEYRF